MSLFEAQETHKRTFIKKRLDALYALMKTGNSTEMVVFHHQQFRFKQFTVLYDEVKTEYHITNPMGNGCSFVLGTTYMSIYIDVKLYEINYRYKLKTETEVPFFLYNLLEQFEIIERDFLQLLEHFNQLREAANNIQKWIEKLFHNSGYGYSLTENENKILLYVPLHNRVQLTIPIYYSTYKQTVPHIMSSIKAFDDVVSSSKIKVFIEKSVNRTLNFESTNL